MEKKAKECIEILIKLEVAFREAGEVALKMRKTAGSRNKYNTGIAGIDIVTEADTAVQEFILSEMCKTKLVECQLFAEEDTELTKKFKGTNGLVLTLDPIDGTIFYASTGRFFSTIVCLHDGKKMLYTFCNYPVVNFSRRIANGEVKDFGILPEINFKENKDLNLNKIIVYTARGPQKIALEVYKKLINEGYEFKKVFDLTDESGSCTLFFSGKVGGYYMETPNPYDGLCALHYGQAKKLKIYGNVNLSKFYIGDHGPHHQGWYLVLNK